MTAAATQAASVPAMTAADALEFLSVIDLTMVRLKLANPDDGEAWDEDQLELGEREYRRFLVLHLMYPDAAIVPCGFVDEFWHTHILDTMAYAEDCESVFGFFLHHFPYFGMRGDDDAAELATAYDLTLDYYAAAFGEHAHEAWADADGRRCRTQCKPQKCR